MPLRTATNTAVNLCIGAAGTAVGFLADHAGTFAAVATGLYMLICAIREIRAFFKK